jgi:hypothetical protein
MESISLIKNAWVADARGSEEKLHHARALVCVALL